MCLLQYLITSEGHYIILRTILRIAYPMKANTSYIVGTLTKGCIFLKRSLSSEDQFNILYVSTLKPHWPYLQKCASIWPFVWKTSGSNGGDNRFF